MRIFMYLSLILSISNACAEAPHQEPIKIGAIYSLTGWAATGGKPELNAALMAVDEINQSGGIAGRKLLLVTEDNRSDFPATVGAFNKLTGFDKVSALIGPNWSEFSEIVVPLAERKQLPIILASGHGSTLKVNRRFAFSLLPSYSSQVMPLSKHIARQEHGKVVLLHSSSTYFDEISEALQVQLKELQHPVTESITLLPKEVDFKSIIEKLKANGTEAVVAFLQEGQAMATLLRQLRELHFKGKIYTNDLSFDEVVSKDWSSANGIDFLAYYSEAREDFTRSYENRFHEPPALTTSRAYDSVYLLKLAIERCGLESSEITRCLREIKYQGALGAIAFDAQGRLSDPRPITRIKQVRNGEVIALEEN